MRMRKYSVTVVTDGSGAATAYTPNLRGEVHSLSYVKAGAANYTDGVDFTITSEETGVSLWTDTNINASETVFPVVPATMGASGAASTLTEKGVGVVGRAKIVIAAGGDTKTGTFIFLVK